MHTRFKNVSSTATGCRKISLINTEQNKKIFKCIIPTTENIQENPTTKLIKDSKTLKE